MNRTLAALFSAPNASEQGFNQAAPPPDGAAQYAPPDYAAGQPMTDALTISRGQRPHAKIAPPLPAA